MSNKMKEDWIECNLDEVCYYSKGKKPPVLSSSMSDDINVPYINIKAFEKGIIDEFTNGEKCNLCEDGDLLMVWDGARAGLTGKAKKGAVGSTLMKIEEVNGIEKQYLFYFLLSLFTKINTNPRGVGIPHVEPRILWLSKILIVSSPIQRAIVSKIEALFSDLGNGIANLKKAQEQLKVYRQAVLKKAFEGGFSITNEEFRITNSENHSSDNLPKGWTKDIVKNVALNIQYGYTESSSQKAVGPKFLRITDIQDYKVNWNDVPYCQIRDEEKSKYLLEDGDLVFARTGATVGKSFLIKGNIPESVFASYLIRLRFPKTINDKYVWYFFHSPMYWSQIINKQVGTGQPNVNGTKLGQLELVLPPTLAEQTQIVQEIESRLSVTDNLEIVIRNSIEKAEALRQSILKKAFEGKLLSEAEIEQCKAAADYEPASELLKKIQAEKAERITNGKLRITKKGQKTGIRN